MKNYFKSLLIAVIGIAFVTSCEGPEGPQGPMGNANVTIWKSNVNSSGWSANGDANVYSFNCPIITSDVINGSYLVSASVEIGGAWLATPYIEAGTGYTESCQFVYGNGSPNSYLYAYSDDDITTLHSNITQVKVAVIEGLTGKKAWTVEEIEANPNLFNITYVVD